VGEVGLDVRKVGDGSGAEGDLLEVSVEQRHGCVCVCRQRCRVVMVFGCASSRCLAIGAGRVWLRLAAQQHHDDGEAEVSYWLKRGGRVAERCGVKGLGVGG
jgi:hypothetical protein